MKKSEHNLYCERCGKTYYRNFNQEFSKIKKHTCLKMAKYVQVPGSQEDVDKVWDLLFQKVLEARAAREEDLRELLWTYVKYLSYKKEAQ